MEKSSIPFNMIKEITKELLDDYDVNFGRKGISNNIQKTVEAEFDSFSGQQKFQKEDLESLEKKIKTLQNRKKKLRNIKNHRFAEQNKIRAQKRKKLEHRIQLCQLKINEIKLEKPE